MTNVPRRRIYEAMLKYEEYLIEITVLARNEQSFNQHIHLYKGSYQNLCAVYKTIKALLILFLENRQYESTSSTCDEDIAYYVKNEPETDKILHSTKYIPKEFKTLFEETDDLVKNQKSIETYEQAGTAYVTFDAFNHIIPRLLELRRSQGNYRHFE